MRNISGCGCWGGKPASTCGHSGTAEGKAQDHSTTDSDSSGLAGFPAPGKRRISRAARAAPPSICCVGDHSRSTAGAAGNRQHFALREGPRRRIISSKRNYRLPVSPPPHHLTRPWRGPAPGRCTEDEPGEGPITSAGTRGRSARSAKSSRYSAAGGGRPHPRESPSWCAPHSRCASSRTLRRARPALSSSAGPLLRARSARPLCGGARRTTSPSAHRNVPKRGSATPCCTTAREARAADRSGARHDGDQQAKPKALRCAPCSPPSSAGARKDTSPPNSPKSCSTSRATPRCGRRTAPPTPPAGWEPQG
jgi:hypothetical protein